MHRRYRSGPAGQAHPRRHHPLRPAAGDHRGAADGVRDIIRTSLRQFA